MPEKNVKAYIATFTPVAVAEMDRTGIPASISMAQAIIESRAGTSILSQPLGTVFKDKNGIARSGSNNHFGIKCFQKHGKEGATHCTNHTDDSSRDFFRRYANAIESWQEHSLFLQKNGYVSVANALKADKDYRLWAIALQKKGYATDPQYAKKLCKIIEAYKLDDLDNL